MTFRQIHRKAVESAEFVGYGSAGILASIGAMGAFSYHTGVDLFNYIGADLYGRTYEFLLQKLSENYAAAAAASSAIHVAIVPALVGFAAYKLVYKLAIPDRKFLESILEGA